MSFLRPSNFVNGFSLKLGRPTSVERASWAGESRCDSTRARKLASTFGGVCDCAPGVDVVKVFSRGIDGNAMVAFVQC